MNHFIDHIEILNFKSIRHLEVNNFKRINLFIGRPNVGKSNILEALSLFTLPYVWEGSKTLTDIIRLENHREFFYDGNIGEVTGISFKSIDKSREDCSISFNRETVGLFINILEHKTHDKYSSTKRRRSFVTDLKFRVKDVSKNKLVSKRDFIKNITLIVLCRSERQSILFCNHRSVVIYCKS